MKTKIFDHGEHINTIVADEDFAASYCQRHGYTYEVIPEPEPEPEPPTYTADDLFAALLGTTKEEE